MRTLPGGCGRQQAMTEPAEPVPAIRLVPESEMTPQQWADEEAAKVGRIWAARWPGGKDWT
jgi:hypothetical protein